MACATTSLAHPKDYVFALRPTYGLCVVMTLSIQNLLSYFLVLCEHMTSVIMS